MPSPHVPSDSSSPLSAIAWMFGSTICMALMHTSIKHVAITGMHPFEIAFFRLLFGLIATLPWFFRLGLFPLKTERLGLLGLRGGLNSIAMLCYFAALSMAPLAEVTALGFSAPIFATLIAIVFLKETVGIRRWFAIGAGFCGAMIILRPGFQELDPGLMLVAVASVFWGACVVIIKSLSRTESSATIAIYMSLTMAPIVLIPASFVWIWPSWEQLAWLAGIGTLGGIGQMCMSEALKRADTHVVIPVDFVRLIWVALLGYFVFVEVPDLYVWMGEIVILGSTAYIAYREHIKSKSA